MRRERELATLCDLLVQAEDGRGQVVGMVGELGAGKSRLLLEFRRSLEGRCLAYGSAIPDLPICGMLRHHCGVTDVDLPEAIAENSQVTLTEAAARMIHALMAIRRGCL